MATSASINGTATLLMVPSFFAMIITIWMNIVFFLKQEPTRRGQIWEYSEKMRRPLDLWPYSLLHISISTALAEMYTVSITFTCEMGYD